MTQLFMTLAPMAHERKQLQVKITTEADDRIEALRAQLGMSKLELLSRVCLWFSGQSDLVQKLVLGLVPSELLPAAKDKLNSAVSSASDPSPDAQAARLAQAARDAAQKAGPSVAPVPAPRKSPRSSGGGSVN